MNINYIFITIFFLSIFLLFKKFNILIDEAKYSEHKIIGKENDRPIVLGGIYLIFVTLFFFDENYLLLKLFSLSVFFIGYLSDRNYLSSPKSRLYIQIIIFVVTVTTAGTTTTNPTSSLPLNSILIDSYNPNSTTPSSRSTPPP